MNSRHSGAILKGTLHQCFLSHVNRRLLVSALLTVFQNLILSLSPYQYIFFLSLRQFCLSLFFGDYSFFFCLLGSLLLPNRKKLGTPTLLIFACLLVQSRSRSFIFLINPLQKIQLSQLWSPLRWLNSTSQQLVNDFTNKKNHICFPLVGESHKNNPNVGIFSKQNIRRKKFYWLFKGTK